jgi:hypothetical protein
VASRIEFAGDTKAWYAGLNARDQTAIRDSLLKVREHGPALRRPIVGTIRDSRHHNMREVISTGKNLRVLFAFDPNRTAVLLVGGDKTNRWKQWYRENIPKADRVYDEHLHRLGKAVTWQATRAGTKSTGRTR